MSDAVLGALAALIQLKAIKATLTAHEARASVRFNQHNVLHHIDHLKAKAVSSLLRDAEMARGGEGLGSHERKVNRLTLEQYHKKGALTRGS